MTSPIPRRRLLFIAACVLLLLLFIRSLPSSRSPQQLQFDKWLGEKEKIMEEIAAHSADQNRGNRESAAVSLPILSLEMKNQPGGVAAPSVFKLVTTENAEVIRRSLRLLRLMREGDIFTIGDESNLGGRSEPHVLLTVQDGQAAFRTAFREFDISGSHPNLLLLKLFTEFAAPPSVENIARP